MEIIVLPFMTISFVIAWAIFAPFASIHGMDSWTFAKIQISDLLVFFAPVCAQFALANWLIELRSASTLEFCFVVGSIFLFSTATFFSGLFVIAKMGNVPTRKRIVIVGIVIPLGTFICIGWVIVPLLAFTEYVFYSIPITLVIIPVVLFLRRLAEWSCSPDGTVFIGRGEP